jgi:hypothetical protein
MTTCCEIHKAEDWWSGLGRAPVQTRVVSDAKAYENPWLAGGEYRPGGRVEPCRGVKSAKFVPQQQQHCAGPLSHIQAIITAARIPRISRISLPPARLREIAILSSVYGPTNA